MAQLKQFAIVHLLDSIRILILRLSLQYIYNNLHNQIKLQFKLFLATVLTNQFYFWSVFIDRPGKVVSVRQTITTLQRKIVKITNLVVSTVARIYTKVHVIVSV